ncbi:hypothetical protein [uncultured Shewanella sp.]|uniref:hypothetical protein n=1 Tax=Shewanella atlantica TaxID=271099 RepID=UPI002617A2DE|nr:hypothetical protein [uncultured Shewanella sp.]
MNLIVRLWNAYTNWCDRMGLTPENRRSCAPRLNEPEPESREEANPPTAQQPEEMVVDRPEGRSGVDD